MCQVLVKGSDRNLETVRKRFDVAENVDEGQEVACLLLLDSNKAQELNIPDQEVRPSLVASRSVDGEKAAEMGVDYYTEGSELVKAVEDAVEDYKERKKGRYARYKLDAVMEHTPASVYFKDTDLGHEEVSDYLLDSMEDPPEAIKGKTDREIYGEGLAKKTMADDRRVVEEGRVIKERMEYSPRDGRYNLTSKGPVRNSEEEIVGLYGITMNVTEKRERMLIMEKIQQTSEELLRSDMKNEIYEYGLKSVFQLVDFQSAGYYVDLNNKITLSKGIKSFESDENRGAIEKVVEKAMETEEDILNQEVGGFFVSCILVGCHGCLALVKDEEITEYRAEALSIMASNVEAALDRVEERQEKRKLRQLGDVISHELRNPLNIAKGYLEELDDSREKQQIEESMDRMEDIINDLGELAKSKEAVDEVKRMQLEEIAEEAWKRIDTKEATLSVEGSQRFRGDRAKIIEVFENLFGNAVEHGGEDVNVEVGAMENGFYVEDDGDGIPEDIEGDIFDYNFKPEEGNTGIGLSIIQKIIEGHGWDIEAMESGKGGARFEIQMV